MRQQPSQRHLVLLALDDQNQLGARKVIRGVHAQHFAQLLDQDAGAARFFVTMMLLPSSRRFTKRGEWVVNTPVVLGVAQGVPKRMNCARVQMRLRLLDREDELSGARSLTRVVLHHRKRNSEALDAITLEAKISRGAVIHDDRHASSQDPIFFLLDGDTTHIGKEGLQTRRDGRRELLENRLLDLA